MQGVVQAWGLGNLARLPASTSCVLVGTSNLAARARFDINGRLMWRSPPWTHGVCWWLTCPGRQPMVQAAYAYPALCISIVKQGI